MPLEISFSLSKLTLEKNLVLNHEGSKVEFMVMESAMARQCEGELKISVTTKSNQCGRFKIVWLHGTCDIYLV